MPSLWLRKFDRDRDFIAIKEFWISDKKYRPGDSFKKESVSLRVLRILYENRRIEFAPKVEAPIEVKAPILNSTKIEEISPGKFAVIRDGLRLTGPLDKLAAERRLAEIGA